MWQVFPNFQNLCFILGMCVCVCYEKYKTLVGYSEWKRLFQNRKIRGVDKLSVKMWTELFWLKDAGLCDLVTN